MESKFKTQQQIKKDDETHLSIQDVMKKPLRESWAEKVKNKDHRTLELKK